MKKLNLNKIFASRSNVGSENRDALPGRYLLKFESFSMLSADDNKKYESIVYESIVFQSNGYKWQMIIYPNGDGSVEEHDHISVYLAIAETSSLQSWEVNATFSFFTFDQIRGRYLLMKGAEQRFDNMKPEWGFSKCISHETFKDPSNGYLVNNICVFGVDLYVIKNHGLGECMSLVNDPVAKSYKHQREISKFHSLERYPENCAMYSEKFTVGGFKWQLQLYPKGDVMANGQSISIFLRLVDPKVIHSRKSVQAKFSISIKEKNGHDHRRFTVRGRWFVDPESLAWGWSLFMKLSKLKDPKKGFIAEDCCIVEADVCVLCVVNGLA